MKTMNTFQRSVEYGKIKIHTHPTFEVAKSVAYEESASTGGWTFPITIARQGDRMFLSGALPVVFVENRLVSRSAVKGASMSDASSSTNRPLEPKHVKDIARYIVDNSRSSYILPSLTLNVQEEINVHTMAGSGDYKAGYIAMPVGVSFTITDGQHRVAGLKEALAILDKHYPERAERLRKDSLAVMVTCEHDIKQIHQDFADCSKTKALPPSLLSVFDMRNPANRILSDVIDQCQLFKGKIDSTSKTLSKKSVNLFLANQVRQMIKHLMTRGNPTDAEFEKRAKEMLGEAQHYEKYLEKYVKYINHAVRNISVLQDIAMISPDSPKRATIPKLREEGWVCLTVTGLNVIGSLGHDIFVHELEDWEKYIDKLAQVDWSRSGETWQGNIVQGGKMMTQTGPTRVAVDRIEELIGLGAWVNERQNKRRNGDQESLI